MHHPLSLPAPPRAVPLSLRILNLFSGLAQLGWILAGFGMIFFFFFATNADLSFATFHPDAETTGRVTRLADTGASENEQPVRAAHYEYSVAGRPFAGQSFSTDTIPAEGEQVTVEYDEDDPARSRIVGMRRALFGPWAMLAAIFPLAGLIILYFTMRGGRKRNHLLRNGIITTGTLLDKKPTNAYVNKRQVWKFTFTFIDRMGQRRELIARTTDTHALQDERAEPLLYDPDDPKRAYLLDEVPPRPKFETNGEMLGRPVAALFALVLPTLFLAINALLLGMKYFR